ncbi:MAG: SpoIIE family protein phosphatase [Planctomycetota bacterium]
MSVNESEYRLALLQALFDQLPDFFYVHNSELRFQYVNQAAAAYFGVPKNELIGKLHSQVDSSKQARYIEDILRPIFDADGPVRLDDIVYDRKDGTRGVLEADVLPFRDPASGEPMLLGISRDITDRARLERERAARSALERELEIARRVQQSLVPVRVPDIAGLDICARSIPAEFVGGDFYDFLDVPERNSVVIMLGDVSGHGVGSALIAASCRAHARAIFSHMPLGPGTARLNQTLVDEVPVGSFVTFAAIEVSRDLAGLDFVSAGHGPTYHVRGGEPVELRAHMPPLGVVPDGSPGAATRLELSAGDSIILPTDGMFEVAAEGGEMMGTERFCEIASSIRGAEPTANACFAAESEWRGDLEAADDRTLIVIHRRDAGR